MVRPRMKKADKEAIAANSKCYVCADLDLKYPGFEGYELREIQMDHYGKPFATTAGSTGAAAANVLPIHAAAGGATPDSTDFENSQRRNCHRAKHVGLDSRQATSDWMRALLEARDATFVHEVGANAKRALGSASLKASVSWDGVTACFRGAEYPVVTEHRRGSEDWSRFLVALDAATLFTDFSAQVREAKPKVVKAMLRTFMLDDYPLFAPVNARVDSCGHVVVFDGNHRATSYALAFGLDAKMPVLIWNINATSECAAVPQGPIGGKEAGA